MNSYLSIKVLELLLQRVGHLNIVELDPVQIFQILLGLVVRLSILLIDQVGQSTLTGSGGLVAVHQLTLWFLGLVQSLVLLESKNKS